jgi:two-component system OmpR family sensor kinase
MQRRSVRTRLTLWYTSLLGTTFLILGLIAYVLVSYTLHKEADSALRSVAVALAERKIAEADDHIPPGLGDIFRHFFGAPPIGPYFEWLDPQGHFDKNVPEPNAPPFSALAKQNAMEGIATFETFKAPGAAAVRVLTWPVIDERRVIAVVRVGMSEMNLQRTMSAFLLTMAGLFPLALFLAGGGGWFLANRALSPVDKMTQTARKIEAGRLHDRLQLSGANDELDRLGETLNEMLGRLEAAFTEMRQFTADASHELQTPLTILRGEIEIALRSKRSEEEYVEVMKSALEEIERISLLVEGLLLLARSDSGVLKLDLRRLDLMIVTEDVLDQLASLASSKPVSLSLGHVEPLPVSADPLHLRRLLFNLIDNAIKYTPTDGSVKVSIEREDGWAKLSVRDTGIGIAPEDRDRVFQRFFRSAEARAAQGGSGLGLSIVKSIVEAHEGKIELESLPGKGSTFTVYLPLSHET